MSIAFISGIIAIIAGLLALSSVALRVHRRKQTPEPRRTHRSPRTGTTKAQRDALLHPVRMDVKSLIDEITAEAMAEEWIEEVRRELPPQVKARLQAKLQQKRGK